MLETPTGKEKASWIFTSLMNADSSITEKLRVHNFPCLEVMNFIKRVH